MPLVRVVVRNEYGLGKPELYREEVNKEDPKAVLDGVAVAGLVGILRQLGDLAQFAAEVFHGLQEQVMSTSSRSHKLMVRVHRIEVALPPLEKAILAQKSHLHFAYTAGSDWHARLQNEQNHFIHGDLPQFIMDYYEECRDPPHLHLLDRFDTGGPGSCLKRYSDPNYFRRASVSSGEANVEKGSKDNAHRSKKKRTWQENEVSHGASISNHTDGFASIKVDGQIFPQTISSFDGTLKSNLGDQSNSFDSATGSGYIECVFHPTSSLKPDENETKESSFSSSRLQHNDALDSASVDEGSTVVNANFPHSLSPEHTAPSSSYVTWDEKTEIVESMDHQYDHDEAAEIRTMCFDGDTLERGAVIFREADQMNFQFDNEDIPISISGQNQLDDVESEPDYYMDALNTIESESETDLECKTKREVEHHYDFNNDRTQDEICGLMAHHSDLQPSNLQSHASAYSSSNEVTSFNESSSILSESHAHEESPQMAGEYSNNGNSLGMDQIGQVNNLDGSNVESDVSNSPYSGTAELNPQATVSDENISNSCEPHKCHTEPSAVQSVKFWTNGGLLGLEPSKPPLFSVPTTLSEESVTRSKNVTTTPSSQSIILNGCGDVGKPVKLVQNSQSIEQISAKCFKSSHIDLDAKHKKDGDSNPSNSFNNNYGCSLSETNAVISEIEQAIIPDVKAISTEANQRDGKNASQMFGLSNRFLLNGFQRNVSLVHDEKSEPPSLKTDVFEQKSRNPSVSCGTVSERTFNGYFGSMSPRNSPFSSPPLQHMKISFQPVNGFETSKLKLEFPRGSYRCDSSRDMLPSFQLVPSPATTAQHDIGSDSDDDTFCRSSPYLSDDCLSRHSESNSEQWESDYTPPSKDNDLYDALRRISSTNSVSSSQELGETGCGSVRVDDNGLQSPYVENCLEPCQSGCTLDLPNLRTMNPLYQQEMKNGSDTKDLAESHFPEETTPLPPPLPPLEWWVMKPLSDVTISKQDSVSESLNHDFDTKSLGLAISPQSKPSTINQQNTGEVIAFTTKCKPEWQKPNGQREVDQAGKGIDEKEDFLHQIRTKSINLRRTTTEKPTVTPAASANVKVTAILEKANAIRQAVGSDDGEDDDTGSDA